jgi:hypothetical protein
MILHSVIRKPRRKDVSIQCFPTRKLIKMNWKSVRSECGKEFLQKNLINKFDRKRVRIIITLGLLRLLVQCQLAITSKYIFCLSKFYVFCSKPLELLREFKLFVPKQHI